MLLGALFRAARAARCGGSLGEQAPVWGVVERETKADVPSASAKENVNSELPLEFVKPRSGKGNPVACEGHLF